MKKKRVMKKNTKCPNCGTMEHWKTLQKGVKWMCLTCRHVTTDNEGSKRYRGAYPDFKERDYTDFKQEESKEFQKLKIQRAEDKRKRRIERNERLAAKNGQKT